MQTELPLLVKGQENDSSPPVTLIKGYLSQKQKQSLMAEAIFYPFTSPQIQIFGKRHVIPRQQAWFGDTGCDTRYSGLTVTAEPWPIYAHKLKAKLSHDFGIDYNGVLVNQYRNGQDSMGWHCDDEPEFKPCSDIASISLGAEREFVVKHKQTKQKYSYHLASGDLLIMHWPMQHDWLHSVPKRVKVNASRLNYTFRQIQPHFFK
ncbi:alpha-ketoglutarate-dependent dioxygenase AlkB [Parashewanella spongiae]|uniref:Alpha-ketoglutarate-dependent dioxygenase AlkB n=1 Tax=Parashewanella spongiae TaxID=342950 RepID=A0A3A6T7E8_9GAMM|nr:alpha-ketoglutarate-dependent dioxygenase AlkB [Parashewanella spongiae]MCL1079503.1 alpha-ketoglutarate-dependent dioxygenase AlkB [Parashewanella spongiae]RJY07511.1 alpha-ketoglutarate-dependent dioxygenase AlkB [Parashewanella spongiae]